MHTPFSWIINSIFVKQTKCRYNAVQIIRFGRWTFLLLLLIRSVCVAYAPHIYPYLFRHYHLSFSVCRQVINRIDRYPASSTTVFIALSIIRTNTRFDVSRSKMYIFSCATCYQNSICLPIAFYWFVLPNHPCKFWFGLLSFVSVDGILCERNIFLFTQLSIRMLDVFLVLNWNKNITDCMQKTMQTPSKNMEKRTHTNSVYVRRLTNHLHNDNFKRQHRTINELFPRNQCPSLLRRKLNCARSMRILRMIRFHEENYQSNDVIAYHN